MYDSQRMLSLHKSVMFVKLIFMILIQCHLGFRICHLKCHVCQVD